MALAETLSFLFVQAIALGCLYVSFRRNAIAWAVIATVLFAVSIPSAMTIPFKTNTAGEVVGTPMNIILSGVAWIFMFVSLVRSVYLAFQALK